VQELPFVDVHIDSRVSLPVYVQLAEQVKYLIQSGQLEAGARLPSPVHLARHLRINKNTIVKAYDELTSSGYIVTYNGRGSYVTDAPGAAEVQAHRDLMRDLDGIVRHGLSLGLSPRQLGNLVMMRAEALAAAKASVSAILLECNSRSLGYYTDQVRDELGIEVVPVLIELLDGDGTTSLPAGAAACDFVICTFYHLADVRRKLRRWPQLRSLEIFAMTVRPHLEVVSRLTALPAGTRLGVVYCRDEPFAEIRLQAMTDAIGQIHLRNIDVSPILFDPAAPDPMAFVTYDALFVRPDNIEAVRANAAATMQIVEFANVLDSASCRMLEEVIAEVKALKAPSTFAIGAVPKATAASSDPASESVQA
jgi:DNA-binding transcriptional regulator YhcF (GntR family)